MRDASSLALEHPAATTGLANAVIGLGGRLILYAIPIAGLVFTLLVLL